MNINVNTLSSPSRGRLFYGRYRSQRAEESRRRRLQLAAIGVACVVAALLTFSLCVLSALLSAPSLVRSRSRLARHRIARLFGSRRPSWCSQPAPMVCAHGGDISAGLANTMPAYRAALAHPAVKCVEVDVSRTRDDILVALHQRQLLTISDGEHERRACIAASCTPAPRRSPAPLTQLAAHACAAQRGRRKARPGERYAPAPLCCVVFLHVQGLTRARSLRSSSGLGPRMRACAC